jgi:WD40 repeat protein
MPRKSFKRKNKKTKTKKTHKRNNKSISRNRKKLSNVRKMKGGGQIMHSIKGHIDIVSCVAFSSDGNYIASGSHDSTIKIWDTKTGEYIKTLDLIFLKSKSRLKVSSVVFSNDGKYIVSGSYDGTVKIWSIETGKLEKMLYDNTNILKFKEDGTYDFDEFNFLDKSIIRRTVAISKDGQYIVSGGDSQRLDMWSTKTGECIKPKGTTDCIKLIGHYGMVNSVAFSNDSKFIVSGASTSASSRPNNNGKYRNTNTIIIWSVPEGNKVLTLPNQSSGVNSVAYSSDDKYIVSGDNSGNVHIWAIMLDALPIKTGIIIREFKHDKIVNSIAVSKNYIVSGSNDNTVKIWSTKTWELIETINNEKTRSIKSVAISNNEEYIVYSKEIVYETHPGNPKYEDIIIYSINQPSPQANTGIVKAGQAGLA